MAPGQRVEIDDLPPEVRAGFVDEAVAHDSDWVEALDHELSQSLARGAPGVGDRLQREFECALIRGALAHTGGHRMEAAVRLGWGRNTLTRKIRELGLEDELRKSRRDPKDRVAEAIRKRAIRGEGRGPEPAKR